MMRHHRLCSRDDVPDVDMSAQDLYATRPRPSAMYASPMGYVAHQASASTAGYPVPGLGPFNYPSSDSRRESFGPHSASADSLSNIWRTPANSPGQLQPCWNIWAPISAPLPAATTFSTGNSFSSALSTPPSPPSFLSIGEHLPAKNNHFQSLSQPQQVSQAQAQLPQAQLPQVQVPPQVSPSQVSPQTHHHWPRYKDRESDKWGSPLWLDSARDSPPYSASSSTSSFGATHLMDAAPMVGAVGSFVAAPRKTWLSPSQSQTNVNVNVNVHPDMPNGFNPAVSPPTSPKCERAEKSSWLLDTPDASSDDEESSPASPPLTASPLLARADLKSPPNLERRPSTPASTGLSSGKTSPKTQKRQADADATLFIVQFKGQRQDVYTAPGYLGYHNGQLVIVDADRGKDLGKIVASGVSRERAEALKLRQQAERQSLLASCAATPADATTTTTQSPPTPPVSNASLCAPKQILRGAAQTEVNQLLTKRQDELAAVALCNEKARERGLNMSIADAEYQWDRRKLTFFYRAGHRVDFRELVRELFRTYKTRIWMCAVPAESTQ